MSRKTFSRLRDLLHVGQIVLDNLTERAAILTSTTFPFPAGSSIMEDDCDLGDDEDDLAHKKERKNLTMNDQFLCHIRPQS